MTTPLTPRVIELIRQTGNPEALYRRMYDDAIAILVTLNGLSGTQDRFAEQLTAGIFRVEHEQIRKDVAALARQIGAKP